MEKDANKELQNKILTDFRGRIKRNRKISRFFAKLEKETASAADVSLFSEEVGRCAADALLRYLSPGNLPDGRLGMDLAMATIKPALREADKIVMDAAKTQQKAEDKKIGVHLEPQESDFPEDRIRRFIEKLVEYREEEIMDGVKIRESDG